jgi:hypothetical protein
MAGWVRYSRGKLTYAGRIGRAPFTAWITSRAGEVVVREMASTIQFALFGKRRAASRRLWRQLNAAARDEDVADAIQLEINMFPRRMGQLTFADGLPRGSVELRRLIVVPRVLLNNVAFMRLEQRLAALPAFMPLDGGSALREFFLKTLIREADRAVEAARPSPAHPLEAGPEWICVGVNRTFAWSLPLHDETPCDGHHYVLELTREPITRSVRKAIAVRVQRFEESLPSLCRADRTEALRRALFAA